MEGRGGGRLSEGLPALDGTCPEIDGFLLFRHRFLTLFTLTRPPFSLALISSQVIESAENRDTPEMLGFLCFPSILDVDGVKLDGRSMVFDANRPNGSDERGRTGALSCRDGGDERVLIFKGLLSPCTARCQIALSFSAASLGSEAFLSGFDIGARTSLIARRGREGVGGAMINSYFPSIAGADRGVSGHAASASATP